MHLCLGDGFGTSGEREREREFFKYNAPFSPFPSPSVWFIFPLPGKFITGVSRMWNLTVRLLMAPALRGTQLTAKKQSSCNTHTAAQIRCKDADATQSLSSSLLPGVLWPGALICLPLTLAHTHVYRDRAKTCRLIWPFNKLHRRCKLIRAREWSIGAFFSQLTRPPDMRSALSLCTVLCALGVGAIEMRLCSATDPLAQAVVEERHFYDVYQWQL